jgi:hypothetical protein
MLSKPAARSQSMTEHVASLDKADTKMLRVGDVIGRDVRVHSKPTSAGGPEFPPPD